MVGSEHPAQVEREKERKGTVGFWVFSWGENGRASGGGVGTA